MQRNMTTTMPAGIEPADLHVATNVLHDDL